MSGIDPSSLPNRSASSPEAGVARVARSEGLHEETSTPKQLSQWQGRPHNGGDTSTGHRGHSEPAVSLSASLGKIALGTTLKATVVGFDTSRQPIIKTDHGTFILDVADIKPPLDLKIDSHIALRIVAIDHVIEAQLITKNNVTLSPPPLLNLTLVGVETASEGTTSALATPATITSTSKEPTGPALYTPQPAQTAKMSTLAKLPAVPLPPSQFLNLRAAGDTPTNATLPLAPPAQGKALILTTGDPHLLSELDIVLQPLSGAASEAVSAKRPAITGQVLNATVVSAQITKAAQPGEAAPPHLTAGQNLLVKIVSVGTDATPLTPTGAALLAAQPERSPGLYPPGQPSSPTSVWRTAGEVIGMEKPTPAQNSLQTTSPSATMGETPAGPKTLLISTPAGTIQLQTTADLPVGSHIVLDFRQAAAQPAQATAPPPPAAATTLTPPLTGQPGKWTAIDNILAKLSTLNPGLAAGLEARIASPLGHLGSATLMLSNALGHTNGAEQWLGRDAVNALVQSGNQSLIAALNKDLQHMSHHARDNTPGDWQTLLLPIRDGRDIQALPILIRSIESEPHQGESPGNKDEENTSGERSVRFVVDVSLSRLGAVQMDGMIRAKNFSLIMRTERTLGRHIRDNIRQIFGAALARNQFEGDLVFRPGEPFPLAATDFLAGPNGAGNQGNIPGNIYV